MYKRIKQHVARPPWHQEQAAELDRTSFHVNGEVMFPWTWRHRYIDVNKEARRRTLVRVEEEWDSVWYAYGNKVEVSFKIVPAEISLARMQCTGGGWGCTCTQTTE